MGNGTAKHNGFNGILLRPKFRTAKLWRCDPVLNDCTESRMQFELQMLS